MVVRKKYFIGGIHLLIKKKKLQPNTYELSNICCCFCISCTVLVKGALWSFLINKVMHTFTVSHQNTLCIPEAYAAL